jgi:hypothetical protein
MIESAHFNKTVVTGLTDGKNAVAQMQEECGVDEIEELQDEIQEQIAAQQEVDDVFIKHGQDEMEGLGDELDELEAEMAALEMEDVDVHTEKIIEVEKEKIPAKKEEEKDPLAAMMAM